MRNYEFFLKNNFIKTRALDLAKKLTKNSFMFKSLFIKLRTTQG